MIRREREGGREGWMEGMKAGGKERERGGGMNGRREGAGALYLSLHSCLKVLEWTLLQLRGESR